MNQSNDHQLLRDYTEHRSESAFTELVRRHVDLVYSTALRMVCDAHLAGDVTQSVFIAFAKNAHQLLDRTALEGWLHGTTRNLAANTVRAEVRRRNHEQEAVIMTEILSTGSEVNWEHIALHLDAALSELSEPERDALLLRYFKNQDFRTVGAILGISDDTAQKRVSRALEQLRDYFAKRKITVGASGLAVLLSANAVQAAPAGLAVTISAAALAGTAATTSTLIAATTKTIAMTALQKTLVTATLAVLASAGIYQARQIAHLREQNQTLRQQQAQVAEQISNIQDELDRARNRLPDLLAENSRLKSNPHQLELMKLRGQVTLLKNEINQTNDPTQLAAKSWLDKVNLLKQRLAQNPALGIPELSLLTEGDWLTVAKKWNLDSDNQYRFALNDLRDLAENKFAKQIQTALSKYLKANDKNFPTDTEQLRDYFSQPVDSAMLDRWQVVDARSLKEPRLGDWAVSQRSFVDDLLDSRLYVGRQEMTTLSVLGGDSPFVETPEIIKPLIPAYNQAHPARGSEWDNNNWPEILSYATTPEQRTLIQKIIERDALMKEKYPFLQKSQ